MDAFKNLMLAGLGVLGAGKDRVQSIVEGMIDKGELTREQGEKVLQSWVDKGKEEQASASSKISDEMARLIEKLNLVTRDDLDRLSARVEELEKRLGEDN